MSKEKGKRKKKKNENYSLLRGSSRVMQTALRHPVSAIHTLTEFLPSLRSHSENMPRAGPATRTRQGQAVLTQVCGQTGAVWSSQVGGEILSSVHAFPLSCLETINAFSETSSNYPDIVNIKRG